MTEKPVKAWICPVCGYIHYGDTPPVECPVCGEPGVNFSPYEEPVSNPNTSGTEIEHVIIIGGGIAGVSAAEAIRKLTKSTQVTLISQEPGVPYYRIDLTKYLAGDVPVENLPIHPKEWYDENSVILVHQKAESINSTLKRITLENGKTLAYDRLVLANGSHPFLPPIDGIQRKNVTTLRTHQDADLILSQARLGKKFVCIGGGILGLETAGAIARSGIPVTVLEALPWLMPRQLNQKAASMLEKRVSKMGIQVRANVKVKTLAGNEAVEGVVLDDGTNFPAEMVVISSGVRPNVDIARNAGITVNQGVVVDDAMKTSDPNIYAAGDVAEHRGILYGTWTPAKLEGNIAGMNSVNQQAAFPGIPRSNKLKVLGFDLMSIGSISPDAAGDHIVDGDINGNYYSFIVNETKLSGAIFLGDASLGQKTKDLIGEAKEFPGIDKEGITVDEIVKAIQSV
jgi:nitrite reductase (NADH) large subunit